MIVTDCNCAHMGECIFVIKCVHFYRYNAVISLFDYWRLGHLTAERLFVDRFDFFEFTV